MQRILLSLVAVPLIAVAANAQCFEQNYGVLAPLAGGSAGFGDDVQFDLVNMNISFPMSAGTAFTHASISDNGILYLTTGGPTTAATGPGNGYQTTGYFVGDQPGDDPRVAPLFMDLLSDPANGGGVWVNNSIPGKFVVTWEKVEEWYATTQPGGATLLTFQVQLLASGEVKFYYDPTVVGATYTAQNFTRCGISEGNGMIDPGSSDLSAGSATPTTSLCLYEEFPVGTPLDLNGQTLQLINVATGYLGLPGVTCLPAVHTSYGEGCYDISNAFYELQDPTSMDLSGQMISGLSLGGLPNTGYLVTVGAGPGGIAPGTAAVVVPLGDDDNQPAGTLGLSVGSNCWIADDAGHSNAYTPSITTMLNQPGNQISAWSDLQPNASGSGLVYYEEVGSTAIVTYDGCYGWGTTDPNTVQITWDTVTGNFSIEFGVLGLTNPENWLVGYAPGGASVDGGNLDLSALASFTVASSNVSAMQLGASPAPLSTPTTGTTVTYTTDNIAPFAPGVYIGLSIISLNQSAAGLPLAFLGAPGCNAYIGTLDVTQAMVGATPSMSVNLSIPAGLPVGFEIYSQSVGLIQPNSLPNGQNPFGMITSNGIKSFISDL